LCPHQVETRGWDVERERVAHAMLDAIRQAESRRERGSGADERLRQIHHGDVRAVRRERSRRAAESAADVENAHTGTDASQAHETIGRRLATAVEVIRGREGVDGERVDVTARRGERAEDRTLEALAFPVPRRHASAKSASRSTG